MLASENGKGNNGHHGLANDLGQKRTTTTTRSFVEGTRGEEKERRSISLDDLLITNAALLAGFPSVFTVYSCGFNSTNIL